MDVLIIKAFIEQNLYQLHSKFLGYVSPKTKAKILNFHDWNLENVVGL